MSNLKSAIYGLAVGDALGVPFEFMHRGTFICNGMTGNGTHNQKAGTWSDDTSMTLATCKSIKENKGVYTKDIAIKFSDWLNKGEYTTDGVVFDFGITTSNAINDGVGSSDICSNGNGSLMRILPLAFTDCGNEEINAVSAITHAHEISQEGCRIYIEIVRKLLSGQKLCDIIKSLKTSERYSRIKEIDRMAETDISSSGYVVDTLEASLWCILNTDNYKDAVIKAVNLGDDTDTVGAVTGGLAGITYGYSSIPSEWIDTLRAKDIIDDCLF